MTVNAWLGGSGPGLAVSLHSLPANPLRLSGPHFFVSKWALTRKALNWLYPSVSVGWLCSDLIKVK